MPTLTIGHHLKLIMKVKNLWNCVNQVQRVALKSVIALELFTFLGFSGEGSWHVARWEIKKKERKSEKIVNMRVRPMANSRSRPDERLKNNFFPCFSSNFFSHDMNNKMKWKSMRRNHDPSDELNVKRSEKKVNPRHELMPRSRERSLECTQDVHRRCRRCRRWLVSCFVCTWILLA